VRLDRRFGTERAYRSGLPPISLSRLRHKQFNERSTSLRNRAQYPSDVIALVVLWRLRYKFSQRDLPEMFPIRGLVCPEAVREWEAKLTPALAGVCGGAVVAAVTRWVHHHKEQLLDTQSAPDFMLTENEARFLCLKGLTNEICQILWASCFGKMGAV
jgi:hypothetical protein